MGTKKIFSAANVSMGIVCLILAFFITMQIKSVHVINSSGSTDKMRAEALTTELAHEQEKNMELYKQLLQSKEEIESFKKEAAD